ncbi:MAG: metal-dependent hydrolase [Acidobacteriota bacterium]
MEPVTHFLTGACLGRSGFNRKTAYATLAMTLAAEAGDLDVLWGFRGPVAGLQHHRGWTHSFVGAPVVALATVGFVWLLHRWRRKEPVIPPRWGWLLFGAWIAAMSHILLDYTVNYGVRPFFPWNQKWYAWSIVFIVDPWLLLALTLALIVPARARNSFADEAGLSPPSSSWSSTGDSAMRSANTPWPSSGPAATPMSGSSASPPNRTSPIPSSGA